MNPLPSLQRVATKLAERGAACPAGRMRVERIGATAAQADASLRALRRGGACALARLQWAIEATGRPLPAAGDITILLDHADEPMLMTRIVHVDAVPFLRVGAAFAACSGYASLSHWRAAQWVRFARECERIGRMASTDMPVVCWHFELLRDLSEAKVVLSLAD